MNIQNIFIKIRGKISREIIVKIIVIAAILIAGGFVAVNYSKYGGEKIISGNEAGKKAVEFINKNFLAGQGQASLKDVIQESGLYKITFLYQNQENEIYVTRNGKYLFPKMQGIPIDLDQKINQNAQQNTEQRQPKSCEEIKKAEKPFLMAFVVSNCPFGLQMQRVLAETIKNIPSLSANINVKYISSENGGKFTSMHGDNEFKENLRQICLREETNKYWDYVSCYMKKGDSASCLKTANIDENKLQGCMSDQLRGLKYIKDDFSLQNKFNVSGSPTLILNDEPASEFDFGGRTAEAVKTLLCCGFKTKPDFCARTLNKESAATSFSESYSSGSGSNSASGCQQ